MNNAKMDSSNGQLYTIEEIPNKGKGLIAAADIRKGTRIIAEKPLFIASNMDQLTPIELEEILGRKLRDCARDDQRTFLSLSNHYGKKSFPFSGIFNANALPLGQDSRKAGIFLVVSRINHDCFPNTHHSWNEVIGCETIHAIKDIVKGEEITISYGSGTHEERQKTMILNFGFQCACKFCCQSSDEERKISDKCIKEIQELDNTLCCAEGRSSILVLYPAVCLLKGEKLLKLLEEAGLAGIQRARTHYDIFQLLLSHGDLARARVFGERAIKENIICEGEDSIGTKTMMIMTEYPWNHAAYLTASSKWSTKINAIPKNLNNEVFENWLWRKSKKRSR